MLAKDRDIDRVAFDDVIADAASPCKPAIKEAPGKRLRRRRVCNVCEVCEVWVIGWQWEFSAWIKL